MAMSGRPRSFYCPDEVWAGVERLAWQMGVSMDDLATDALARYLRDRANTAMPPAPSPAGPPPLPPTLITAQAPPRGGYAPTPPPPPVRQQSAPPPPVAGYGPPPMHYPGGPPPMPPPPPAMGAPPPPLPPGGGYGQGYGAPPPPAFPSPRAPAPPAFEPRAPTPQPQQPMSDGPPNYPIFLYCEGQRAQIMQPRFVIGRSRSASDFAINDSNVSRQHCAVEWLRGHYHIVDMGSTNGILFNGRRIER